MTRWERKSRVRGNSSMKNDAFYKMLLDNLYDGVYFVDPLRTITYWNKGAERITGYTAAEVIGKRCADNILCIPTRRETFSA